MRDSGFFTENHAGEGARDFRLALAWIAALLLVGGAANICAMWFGAGQ